MYEIYQEDDTSTTGMSFFFFGLYVFFLSDCVGVLIFCKCIAVILWMNFTQWDDLLIGKEIG